MKLLSISLIAASLTAIVGSAAAAPTLHAMERNSIERDVSIYSRATESQHTEEHHRDHQAVTEHSPAKKRKQESAERKKF